MDYIMILGRNTQYYKDACLPTYIYRFQTIPLKSLIGQANSKNVYGRAKA